MDWQEPGRLERNSSQQSLQFNPFLQEIGFYKQNKDEEQEHENTENNIACEQMISSIKLSKEDIDASYLRCKQQKIVKDQPQPIFKKESDEDDSSSSQFIPFSKQTPKELKTILQNVNSKLKELFNKRKKDRQLGNINTQETKNVDSIDFRPQETFQSKHNGRVFRPIFVQPKEISRHRLHNRIRKITNQKLFFDASQKMKRFSFPFARAEQPIYVNKLCFPSGKQTVKIFCEDIQEEMASIKKIQYKKSVSAIQFAVFQAYKQDNQQIVQSAIVYLAELLAKQSNLYMKKQVSSKESIDSFCRQWRNTGFITFAKYSTQILQKRINQILFQYSQGPIQGVDIRLQIVSHFFKSANTFNEYRFIKQHKKDGLTLSSHLKMLNYNSDQVNNMKYYFLKHQHEIKYFDGGFNIEKVANAYIFLLKKLRLQRLLSQQLSLLPKNQLVDFVKAQRMQLISKKPIRVEQSQRKYFSSFAIKEKNHHKRKRKWTSQHIMTVANVFNRLIDQSQQVIMEQIKQITRKYGKNVKRNYQLFQKYKSNMVKFNHQFPQLIVQDKMYQIRKSLSHHPFMTMLQIQKEIFFKKGIYVCLEEIAENIDQQLEILIKQLLYQYMNKIMYQLSKRSVHLPIAFIDTFTTKLQLLLSQDKVFGGQSRVQNKQVTFCYAVSSDGRAVCKIFFENVDLELLLSSIIYHLDKTYIFAFYDTSFLEQNWFQRKKVKQLNRIKNNVIPIPSFASIPNPCKIIRQQIQLEVIQHHHSQTSLRHYAQNIGNQLQSQSIKRIFAQNITQTKLLFNRLKEKQSKSFKTTRSFQFDQMKLVINRQFASIKDLQTTLMFKKQTSKLQSSRGVVIKSQKSKKYSLIEQNSMNQGQKKDLIQQEIIEVIGRMSLEDRRIAVEFLLFYNEKEMLPDRLPANI